MSESGSVGDLFSVLGDPPSPPSTPIDWTFVEETFGVGFPSDFRALCDRYGSCYIGGRVVGWTAPTADAIGAKLLGLRNGRLWFTSRRKGQPTEYPYCFWPEPNGLFPWAWAAGAQLFWHYSAGSSPDEWPIVTLEAGDSGRTASPVWNRFEMSTCAFLVELLRGNLVIHRDGHPRQYELGLSVPFMHREPIEIYGRRPRFRADAAGGVVLAERLGYPSQLGGPPWPLDVPPDYRALVDRSGPATLPGGLRLLGPTPGANGMDIGEANTLERVRVDDLLDDDRNALSIDRGHPAPGGLVEWGLFPGGQTCFWLPVWPDPSGWPIVVRADDGLGWQRLDISTAEFLHRWLDDDLTIAALRPSSELPSARTLTEKLALLRTIIGPGTNTDTYDFTGVAERLGVAGLPADYLALVAEYGQFIVDGMRLRVPGGVMDIASQPEGIVGPGQLWCVGTEARDTILWNVTGQDPDAWHVTYANEVEEHDHPGALVDCLLDFFLGRLNAALACDPDEPPRHIVLSRDWAREEDQLFGGRVDGPHTAHRGQ